MNVDKRWRAGEERWRAPEHGVFDPSLFAVDVIEGDNEARAFVESQHYSGSYPAARFRVGLYGPGAGLVGVAVFSEPTHPRFIPKWTSLAGPNGVELGRFVLVDSVAYNAETWMLKRAFALLRREKPEVEAVVSCADPMERHSLEGMLTKPAHWGTIYKASSALFAGRTTPRWVWLAPDGTILNERMLSKIRNEERGWRYGCEVLVRHGAPVRKPHETLRSYLVRVLAPPTFRKLRHPGNLAYIFGLTTRGKSAVAALHGKGLPYVKTA